MQKTFNKQILRNQTWIILFCSVMMGLIVLTTANVANAAPIIERHQGDSRENVAVSVAETHFQDSNKVIIVNRNKFPDAISATNISQGRYPVLYTNEGHVREETIQLIQSMALEEIYVLGGESSIHPSVVNQLKNIPGVKVTRIDGSNRYEANVNAIKPNFSRKNHVVIASGQVYADALYGVSYANTIDAPIILTRENGMTDLTIDLLRELKVSHATIIGGTVTVTTDVEDQLSQLGITYNRIAGKNRYTGSAEVAKQSYLSPQKLVIASGEVFPDALVSAPLAQKIDAPILLVRSNQIHPQVENYIANNLSTMQTIYIQGGPRTIQPSLVDSMFNQTPREPTDILDISFDMERFNYEIIDLINEERSKLGRVPLYYEPALQPGVNMRTLDSISIQTLRSDHARPDGSPWTTAFQYLADTPVFVSAENIAFNSLYYSEYEELVQTPGALETRMAQMFYNQYAASQSHYGSMVNAGFDGMATSTMFADHGNSNSYMRIYNTMVFSINY